MRTIETNIYTLDEHPNKDKCFEWIRNNWHSLNQHSVDEIIESIKALNKVIGGTFDYSISQVPDRGEHITFTDYDREALCHLSQDDCPLTGCCWDIVLIESLRNHDTSPVLHDLHKDTEYQYSDEGLTETIEANEYEFIEDGSVF